MADKKHKIKVLILGAGGMLGSTLFRFFSDDLDYDTYGTLRSPGKNSHFSLRERQNLIANIDVRSDRDVLSIFSAVRPDVVINCVGIIKQVEAARDKLTTIEMNATLPHRLVKFCEIVGARLIHMGTDCVFSGDKGGYTETDFPDANDLYGRSKYMGEIDYPNTVTLRTSIIGHELETSNSLIDWFLNQSGSVKGYTNAVFSGLPTVEIARVIRDIVIPNESLSGLYHLSAQPIDKFTLLSLVKEIYGTEIDIVADGKLTIDRSLNSERFRAVTGYSSAPWPDLIALMHEYYLRRQQPIIEN